jgi:DNA invertase Pin-like site-specific DNA recombinase
MTPIQAALYARVSSAQQAEAHTVASQVVALRERVAADGLAVPEALQCIDEGYRGAALVRPALERLRALVAAGAVDRLSVHSPDRLARPYAYQVLVVDECQRAGVEVIFLNRALGRSPEDELLWQVQGMMAEYERAKSITQGRTDLLALAVWQEVWARLAQPARLAAEYQRRWQPDPQAKPMTLATLATQLGTWRQGLARLLESYAEGLLARSEFEPRLTRLRQRIAPLEAPCQALAEAAALQTEGRVIIGRLEDVASKVYHGLAEADWMRKREMIRTLVTRVEVAQDQVRVVFRVEPRAGDPSPEKKSLHLCRRSSIAAPRQRLSPRCLRPVGGSLAQERRPGRWRGRPRRG